MADQRLQTVVVTGIGLVTGLGGTRESTWAALKDGGNALRRLDGLVPEGVLPWAGAPWFDDGGIAPECGGDPALSLLLRSAHEALTDAGLGRRTPDGPPSYDPERVATLAGLSKGCLQSLARRRRDNDWISAAAAGSRWPDHYWPNAGALAISRSADLRGPCLAPVAACATGLVAALQAADLIRRGACDIALAGAGDASLDPLVLGAFQKMGVLARGDGAPSRALRPWDRRRSGFLVGEGAAVLVLERADHARERGAVPYVEFAGGAFGADGYHETSQNPDPSGLADLIARALVRARTEPSEIDLANVHGTATPSNDPLECRALRLALGAHAENVSCTANKSQIGHLLGAAGAAELAIACLSVRDGIVPPTLNLDDPDPACDLDATPHVGRRRSIRAALKLSIGFGGHLAAAVVRRIDGESRAR
ncbi:MAG: beta-ketoacyl-[acyl-carrier-protein] synthase family protein [Isosphaeraceae bacterium]|nr:beta-ketoacyl-[acyl-carrier-protein] synthase family protein [Isosphaeraceae bacterium]